MQENTEQKLFIYKIVYVMDNGNRYYIKHKAKDKVEAMQFWCDSLIWHSVLECKDWNDHDAVIRIEKISELIVICL